MMLPYGWTTALLGNYQEMYDIGLKGRAALTAKFNTNYKIGSIANVICKLKLFRFNSEISMLIPYKTLHQDRQSIGSRTLWEQTSRLLTSSAMKAETALPSQPQKLSITQLKFSLLS